MKPQYIVVSGIDGAGKTSIIEGLSRILTSKGVKTHYIWMRYNHYILKIVHGFCRVVGLSKKHESAQGKVWRHEFYRSQLFCSYYIVATWIDCHLGRFKLLRQVRKKIPDVVICDRWINDVLIDLSVDTRREHLLDTKWHDRFRRLMPSSALQLLIERPKEAILECRPEYRGDLDFEIRQKMYLKLKAKRNRLIVVNNKRSLDHAIDDIFVHINKILPPEL